MEHWTKAMKMLPHAAPLHASVLFMLRRQETPAVPIAGVSGTAFYINPEGVSKEIRNLNDAAFVFMHEAEHVLRLHMFRRRERDPVLWNIACDFVINRHLISHGIPKPSGRPITLDDVRAGMMGEEVQPSAGLDYLYDESLKGLSEEEIYEKLLEMRNQCRSQRRQNMCGGGGAGEEGDESDAGDESGASGGSSSGGDQSVTSQSQAQGNQPWTGDLDYSDEATPAAKEGLRRQVEAAVKAHLQQMKERGHAAGRWEELIELYGQLQPKVDWRRRLARFFRMHAGNKSELTYTRPNRWAMVTGSPVMLPGELRYGVPKIVLIIDTSGSMGQEEFRKAFAEVKALVKATQPDEVVLIEADVSVQRERTLSPAELRRLREFSFAGRGGTSFSHALRRVDEAHSDSVLAIYFTDGWGNDPKPPKVPVLWVVINEDGHLSAKCGDKVHVPLQ